MVSKHILIIRDTRTKNPYVHSSLVRVAREIIFILTCIFISSIGHVYFNIGSISFLMQ